MSEQEAESLYHYGVKGMRWGHRKARDAETKTARKARDAETKAARKTSNVQMKTGNALYAKYRKMNPDDPEYKKTKALLTKYEDEYVSTRKIADRATTGEAWVTSVLGVAVVGAGAAVMISEARK